MTQEKLKRVVTAAAVAGTLIVVCLFAVILYQIIHISVLNKRIKAAKNSMDYYQEQIIKNQGDLSQYESDWWLEQEAYKYHFIKPGDKVNNK